MRAGQASVLSVLVRAVEGTVLVIAREFFVSRHAQ
jgi:hypothetical protein